MGSYAPLSTIEGVLELTSDEDAIAIAGYEEEAEISPVRMKMRSEPTVKIRWGL
jgi:hypothetical protein